MPEIKLGNWGVMRGSEVWLGLFSGKLTPKQAVNEAFLKKISAEARVEMTAIREEVQTEYDGYAKGWRHKPTFVVTVTGSVTEGGNARHELKARTTKDEAGEIFGYVDKGTTPHTITAGGKPMPMRPYKPRTTPGGWVNMGGGVYGPKPWKSKLSVVQSIAARNFTQKSREFWKKEFPRRMRHAARTAFRRKTR